MLNFTDEELLPLGDVVKLLPRRNGKKLHVCTVYRWAQRGLRGTRLETLAVGGRICTSREALQRFFERLSQPGQSTGHRTSRKQAVERAERELRRQGI